MTEKRVNEIDTDKLAALNLNVTTVKHCRHFRLHHSNCFCATSKGHQGHRYVSLLLVWGYNNTILWTENLNRMSGWLMKLNKMTITLIIRLLWCPVRPQLKGAEWWRSMLGIPHLVYKTLPFYCIHRVSFTNMPTEMIFYPLCSWL